LNAVVLGADFGRQVQDITLEARQQRGIDLRVTELFAQAWEYWL